MDVKDFGGFSPDGKSQPVKKISWQGWIVGSLVAIAAVHLVRPTNIMDALACGVAGALVGLMVFDWFEARKKRAREAKK